VTWGTLGNGNGKFINPMAIDIADPTEGIYVAEWNNFRVQKFAREAPITVQEVNWGEVKNRYRPVPPLQ